MASSAAGGAEGSGSGQAGGGLAAGGESRRKPFRELAAGEHVALRLWEGTEGSRIDDPELTRSYRPSGEVRRRRRRLDGVGAPG